MIHVLKGLKVESADKFKARINAQLIKYRGFDIYSENDGKWYWKNPNIDAPVEGMLSANSKQDIKTIIDFMFVYYDDLEETM